MRELVERFLDADLDDLDEGNGARRFWERIDKIPARELWEAHQRQKRELSLFARGRLRSQFARHGEAPSVLEKLDGALDPAAGQSGRGGGAPSVLEKLEEALAPAALTIGFARRFATYKRTGMIFSDI